MVTASHNPKAYTGVKLVREGALALSGDTGITAIRDLILAGLGDAPGGGGSAEDVDIAAEFRERALSFIDVDAAEAAQGRRRRRQRDGRRDGRPAARRVPDRADRDLLGARRQLPRPRAEPAAAREPRVHHRAGPLRGRRPRHRLGRRRRPLLLHRRRGRVRRRRLPDRAARRAGAREGPGRRHPLRRPRQPGGPRHGRRPRRHRPHQPGRARVHEAGDEGDRRRVRRRGLRPLLLPPVLQRRLGNDPGAARARADLEVGPQALRPRRRAALEVLHQRRDQLRGRRPRGEDEGDRRAPSRRRGHLARRRLGRLPGLALQRPPVEHRAAAAAQPRVARLARGHGGEAGRGARR